MSNPTTPFSWQMPTATDLVTDLPADFAVFGQAVATSMQYLLGGTTGQILSKTSATDMAFTWIANDQGDITGVTATSPLTGGGSSGAITVGIQDALTTQKGAVQLSDSTSTTSSILAATPTAVKSAYDLAAAAIPKSTVTTNGDVIYATGSSAVTRLGIGSTSQVLTVAGGVPTWAAPAGGGGMTLLSTTTLSGAGTTISSIDQSYINLQIFLIGVNAATNGYYLEALPNSSTTLTDGNYFAPTSTGSGKTFDNIEGIQLELNYNSPMLNANTDNSYNMTILNYASATSYKAMTSSSSFITSGTNRLFENSSTYFNSATAITSIQFRMRASGVTTNFNGGTVLIYGVK